MKQGGAVAIMGAEGTADIINLDRLTSNTNHVHSSPVLHLKGVESFHPTLVLPYDFHLKLCTEWEWFYSTPLTW